MRAERRFGRAARRGISLIEGMFASGMATLFVLGGLQSYALWKDNNRGKVLIEQIRIVEAAARQVFAGRGDFGDVSVDGWGNVGVALVQARALPQNMIRAGEAHPVSVLGTRIEVAGRPAGAGFHSNIDRPTFFVGIAAPVSVCLRVYSAFANNTTSVYGLISAPASNFIGSTRTWTPQTVAAVDAVHCATRSGTFGLGIGFF